MISQLNRLEQEQYMYIVFSSTNTKMGRFIRFFTKYKYNHVSLTFVKNFDRMYSFARYSKNSPLVGGFVEESTLRYFEDKNNQVQVKVCRIPITMETYEQILGYVNLMQSSNQYIYNTFSAILHSVHKGLPIEKSYTCVEFVGEVLNISSIDHDIDFNQIYSIAELEHYLDEFAIFEGDLKEIVRFSSWGNDAYLKKIALLYIWTSTIKHMLKLVYRIIKPGQFEKNKEIPNLN